MRLENGMRFDHCIGLQDRDALDGKVFDGNVLVCHDKPLNSGESIKRDLRFLASVPPCFLASWLYSPHFLPAAKILITKTRLEMAAND